MSPDVRVPCRLTVLAAAQSSSHGPVDLPSELVYPGNSLGGAFAAPTDAVAVYRVVKEILRDVFAPTTPFDPPADVDFSLDRPRAHSLSEILAEVRSKVVAHAVHPRSPMVIAHMVPPPATVSILADLLIGALNQCAFTWEEAPAATDLELEVVTWMAARLGFGPNAGGLLTSGGTMSNYMAALLALSRARLSGLDGDKPCIVASDQAHLSVEKSAVMLGLGSEAVVRVATDAQNRTVPGSFLEATRVCRAAGQTPFLFLCTAGTPSTGALEALGEVLRVARDEGAWCHVDAAHGGFVSLAHGYRATTAAWTAADSVSWDPHKSLYASYAVGALFLRDPTELQILRFNGDYALRPGDRGDAGKFHLEGSRRLEALKLWMCIRYFGVEGYSDLAERSLSTSRHMADRIKATAGLTLVTEPDTNVVCFRFEDPRLIEEDVDDINLLIQSALFRDGGPLLSSTRVGGRPCLRAVILNPNFTPDHVVQVLDRVSRVGKHLAVDLAQASSTVRTAAR